MPNSVDHPAHYGGLSDPYEAIKVIEAWQLNFNLGNVLKYIRRTKSIEDLEKARWYLDREIANRKAAEYPEFPGPNNLVAAIATGAQVQPTNSYKLVVERGVKEPYVPAPYWTQAGPGVPICSTCTHPSKYHHHVSRYNDQTGKADPDSVSCEVCGCQAKQETKEAPAGSIGRLVPKPVSAPSTSPSERQDKA